VDENSFILRSREPCEGIKPIFCLYNAARLVKAVKSALFWMIAHGTSRIIYGDPAEMKIGFNLLLWTGFVEEEHHDWLEKLKKAGYDGVEIPLFAGTPEHYAALKKVLDANGLSCTAVTVMPDEQHSCISPDPVSRQGAVSHLKWALDCCQAMGAEVLLGPMHQPLGIFSGEGPTADEKKWCVDTHKTVAEYAQQVNVHIALESLNRFECYFLNTIADAAAHVAKVNHPFFGTMYDTFHANIEEKDPIGVIAPHIGAIRHVHISENDRGTPGKGHVPFAATFKALKSSGYDQWLTIEAFGRALPALAAATRVWRDFFPSAEEVYTDGIYLIKNGWNNA